MKHIFFAAAAILALAACKSNDTVIVDPPANETVSTQDVATTNTMRTALSNMESSLDSLIATTHHSHQVHWDSLYHHHDSLFWHHHNLYHHDTYTHDDHHHTWVAHHDSSAHH